MRLAWFRHTHPDPRGVLDESAALIAAVGRANDVEIVTSADAHNFVWKHDREPYDLCVYELGRTRTDEFPWPYLLQYPGVLMLRSATLADPRGWGRSRVIVVADAAVAQSLQAEWPEARLRVAPGGSNPEWEMRPGLISQHSASGKSDLVSFSKGGLTPTRVGTLGGERREVVERAVARAAQRGASVTLLGDGAPRDVLRQADVVVATEWPPAAGPPWAALQAMAAGLAVIVLELEATAGWPALDPQTWLPRGFSDEAPVAVSIDPRDEEHSLMLAIVRLSADADVRKALGIAGHRWWSAHARVDHATAAFERILREAVTLGPASLVPVLDGSESARAVLAELGVRVDFL